MSAVFSVQLHELLYSEQAFHAQWRNVRNALERFAELSPQECVQLRLAIKNFLRNDAHLSQRPESSVFFLSIYINYLYDGDSDIDACILPLFRKLTSLVQKNCFMWNILHLGFSKNLPLEAQLASMFVSLVQEFTRSRPKNEFRNISMARSNNVVIATTQLLSENHSPTRLVLDKYLALKEMGFNPVILLPRVVPESQMMTFVNPYIANFVKASDGVVNFQYSDCAVQVCNFSGENFTSDTFSAVMQFLVEFQPRFMLAVGGWNVYNEYLSSFIPTLLFPTSVMLTPAPNAKMVSIANELGPVHEKILHALDIAPEKYQHKVSHGVSEHQLTRTGGFHKEDLQFAAHDIVLAIASNRLDLEIDSPELQFIADLSVCNEHIHFLIIGNCSELLKTRIAAAGQARVKFLGMVPDLGRVLHGVDMLINTRRLGGGTTSTLALGAGTLVYSIAFGDVSHIIPMEFQAADYKALRELICGRLLLDRAQAQERALGIFHKLPKSSENLHKLLLESGLLTSE